MWQNLQNVRKIYPKWSGKNAQKGQKSGKNPSNLQWQPCVCGPSCGQKIKVFTWNHDGILATAPCGSTAMSQIFFLVDLMNDILYFSSPEAYGRQEDVLASWENMGRFIIA